MPKTHLQQEIRNTTHIQSFTHTYNAETQHLPAAADRVRASHEFSSITRTQHAHKHSLTQHILAAEHAPEHVHNHSLTQHILAAEHAPEHVHNHSLTHNTTPTCSSRSSISRYLGSSESFASDSRADFNMHQNSGCHSASFYMYTQRKK